MAFADKVETPTTEAGLETASVELSPAAVDRVRRLLEERQLPGHALRVFISGGGCSGLQYGMALEGQPRETDLRFAFDGVDVVVDPMSMEYLAGARIDYIDDVMGGGFKIDNPNAVASCGCGHSFRTSRDGAASSEAGCGCH
jgi:iron-sulfur cluster assembly accessory protein